MDRKEFLSTLGAGAAFALTVGCLGGCNKSEEPPAPVDVNLTIDLTDSQNAELLKDGGYIIRDKVVIAKNTTGEYVAATQLCSHENLYEVIFKGDEWFCTAHSARFSLAGEGLNSNGSKGLTIYKTALDGDILQVSS